MFIRNLLNKNNKKYGTFTAEEVNTWKVSNTDELVIDIDEENTIPILKSGGTNIWKVISIGLLLFIYAGFFFVTRKTTRTKVQILDAVSDSLPIFQEKKISQIEAHAPYFISYIEESFNNGASNICEMPKVKVICKGNLGEPRKCMPQLSHHVAKKYYKLKRKQGIRVEHRIVEARKLIMVQNELDPENVLDMYYSYIQGKFNPCLQVIPVSMMNGTMFIIDGHHRAMTCIFTGGEQHVMVIEDSVKHILDDLKHFKGVTYNTSIFKPPKKSDVFKDEDVDVTDVEMANSSFGIKQWK